MSAAHLNGIQEAVSSILSSSTRYLKNPRSSHRWSGVFAFGETYENMSFRFPLGLVDRVSGLDKNEKMVFI